MELKCAWLLLLLVYTDISYSAAPTCKSGCTGQKGNVLKLQEGTTYVYNLEGNTETSVPKTSGPNGESAKLGIRAKVEVNIQPACSALIRLKNVQIIGPDDKKHGSLSKLEQNPLRVSLNGGSLAPEVCAVPEDDYTSLNIKRAVASLLQINAAESSTVPQEVDVFGLCSTTYNVRQDGDATVIRKTRDLNSCAYRENIRQELFSIPNAGSSELQSAPLLDPTYEAEISIKGGIVDNAVVRESYLFRPFSNGNSGAKTIVTTKLTLASKSAGSLTDTTKEPRSIIYENPHEVASSSIQTVVAALHKVVDNTENSVDNAAARNFAELVAIIRRASADDLLSVYGQVKAGAGFKNKQLARKVFNDALFRSGSSDSIAVAIELLKSRQIEGNTAKLWYLSFAFARHASSSALAKATTLLDEPNLPREAYLGIGALAGKYCREHVCETVPQFNALLAKLASPLAKPVPSSRSDETKLVGSLKALRNVKKLSEDVAAKVANVIKESKAPIRVRAAALETAVSDACKNRLQKAAAEILNNREEDSELRIKAYLVLVECPNAKTGNKLMEFLETEPVNQVGSYISSHLRNLRATANPDKQAARALLQNVKPRRRFPIDIRRFSQNFEASYDVDAIGSSGSAQSNVIYSQNSYLPRSANLNLTAEVFGHAFNLFEISGRAENLERIVERFFGPKGYVRNTKPEDIYRDTETSVKKLKQQLDDKLKSLSRSKRSATLPQINSFAEKVKLRNSELDNNVDVDVSLSLLGNELLWINLGEKDRTVEDVINQVADILEKGLGKIKNFDHQIQHHGLFLDSELSYPTSTGLPIKLTATGTSVVHVKLAGNLDQINPFKIPKDEAAKIEIRPSASIEVVGKLTVDGYAVETGIKLASSLHTATGTEIAVKLLDGQGIDVNIGLPVKESDILTIETEVLVATRERGQPLATSPLEFKVPRKDFQGCFDQLMPLIGLTLCGSIGFPNDATPLTSGAALYPLNGHSKISLRLDKEDVSLTTYHFRFLTSLRDPTNRRVEVLLETPGSANPRELKFLAEAKTVPNKEINLELLTPIYKLRGQAKLTDTDKEYSVTGLAELEGVFLYKAHVGLLINGATFTPILEYTGVDGKPTKIANIEGSITLDKTPGSPKKKVTFNNLRFTTDQFGQVSVEGTVNIDTNLYQTDVKLGYENNGKQTVGIKGKLQRQGENNLKVLLEVAPSQLPDVGFGLKYEYQRDKKHIENSFSLVHGPDLASKTSKLSIFQQISFNIESLQRFDVATKNSLSYPLFAVEGKLEGAATQKSVSYDLLLGYEKNTVTSKLSAKTGITKPGDYEIDFSAAALNHGVRFEAKRDVVAPNKSKFSNSVVFTPGGRYALDADVTHQLDRNNVDTKLAIVVSVEGVADPYKLDIGALFNPSALEAHSKVAIGARVLLDAEIKQKRSQPTSGSFRLNLEKVLESHGEYQRNDGKATANFIFDVIPLKKLLKGTADLTATGPKHVGSIVITLDNKQGKVETFTIKTDTDLTSKSINSKNNVLFREYELVLNFNGEVSGKPGNGAFSGGYDIVLPDGRHLVARTKQALNLLPGNSNGEFFLDLGYSRQKGTQLTKVTWDSFARNVDLKRYSFDTKVELKTSCETGDAYYTQAIKNTLLDGKYLLEIQNALGGSRLGEYQYNGKTKATISRSEISYHTSATLGQKYTLNAEGKIHPGLEDRVHGLENSVHITTPVDSAKDIITALKVKIIQGDETRPCQVTFSNELTLNEKTYKLTSEGKGNKREGSLKNVVIVASGAPYTTDLTYKHSSENDVMKGEVGLDAKHNDKNVKLNLKADYTKDLSLINAHLVGATPLESSKKIDISVGFKRISSVSGSGNLKWVLNENEVEASGKVDVTSNHPLVEINGQSNGEKFRVFWKLDKKTERNAYVETSILYRGQQVDYSANVDLESLENFLIVIKANAEYFKLNKFKLEVGNRPSKSGTAQRVNVVGQDASGKLFGGSANYALKETLNSRSIEGKGTLNFKGKDHPLTYKLITTKLTKEANKETGRSMKIVIDFTTGSYHQELKATENEYTLKQNACYEKKCYVLEILSKTLVEGLQKQKSQLTLKLNNDLFEPRYNLGVESKTERNGAVLTSDTVANVLGNKYAIHAHVKPTDAALVLDVPTREVAAVAVYQVPDLKKDHSSVKLDLSLALDRKKSPNDKASFILEGALSQKDRQLAASGSAKFQHPNLQRELSIKGEGAVGLNKNLITLNVEADVLNKKSQKISVNFVLEQNPIDIGRNVSGNLQIISKGLSIELGGTGHAYASRSGVSASGFGYFIDEKNLKKEAGALVSLSIPKTIILVKLPSGDLVNGEASITSGTDQNKIDAELTLAGGETGVLMIKTSGLKEISACLHAKSKPTRKLEGLISLTPEKLEGRLTRSIGGKTDNLVAGTLYLGKENLFKVDYDLQVENIKQSTEHIVKIIQDIIDRYRVIAENVAKEYNTELINLAEALKKAQPNLKPLIQQYQNTFKAIREELEKDKIFQTLSDTLKKLLGGYVDIIEAQIKLIIKTYEKIASEATDVQAKLIDAYKKISPEIIEIVKKIAKIYTDFAKNLLEIGSTFVTEILKLVREHEGEVKALINSASDSLREIGLATIASVNQLKSEIHDFINLLLDQIRSLPAYSNARQRIQEVINLEIPPHIWELYNELALTLEGAMPTEELGKAVKALFAYVEKRIRQQPVDDIAEISAIARQSTDALIQLFTEIFKSLGININDLLDFNFSLPIPRPAAAILKLPDLGKVRFSPFALLSALNELPSPLEFYMAYRPTLNPLDQIPPFNAFGLILNSHHFFTFDNRHVLFKGAGCSYVLAQDFLDGNFSIVANINDGKVNSLSIAGENDVVELLNDNTVIVNGKKGDFPVNTAEVNGWRRYNSVNIKLRAGVLVTRYLPSDIYVIRVSGFYHGRTRGLLGTINNEQYDELTLPNGHIAKDSTELGNAYRLSDCPAVPEVKQTSEHAADCTNIFTSDSALRNYFHIVNPEPFREACDQHSAMHKTEPRVAACEVAGAYVAALRQAGAIFVAVPPQCAQCTVGEKKVELGQSEQITSPAGKADVVIVVEQSTLNAAVFDELVTPLISTLAIDLKEKGINDLEVAIIGFGGPKQKWPQHYGNNGKVTYTSKPDTLTFGDRERLQPPYDTLLKKIKIAYKFIKIELGMEQVVVAMNEANLYPFRQGASKNIILINTTPCSRSPIFPVSLQIPRSINIYRYYREHGLNFYIVSPLGGLALGSADGKPKTIVGFDSEKVYYPADAGKKEIEGSSADRTGLAYEKDLCLEFSQYYGGAAFSSKNLIDAKPDQRKKFVQVISQRIVQGAVKWAYTEDCTCTLKDGIIPVTECTIASREKK